MGVELRPYGFDRIVLLTNHTNRSLVAVAAKIPQRLGYGTSWLQRRLLTSGPWIQAYSGPAVTAYKDVTAFAIAHGFSDAPVVPSLVVRQDALAHAGARLAGLPRPLHALAIGASEPYKQWGADNFAALATQLARAGHGVILLAGPAEREMAHATLQRVDADLHAHVRAITDGSVAETVATMSLVQSCIGNDTGAANIAAAVGTPTWVVLGPRPPLEHDPQTLQLIVARSLAEIRPDDVAQRVLAGLAARPARS
jgi:heptosyltransferase-2